MSLDWQEYAACAALPIEEADRIFFPPVGGSSAEAKAICNRCPVIAECRRYTLSFRLADLDSGIFAGMSERDRRLVKGHEPEPEWVRPSSLANTYHGTWSGYCNHGCRCANCSSAAAQYRREQRAKRKSA